MIAYVVMNKEGTMFYRETECGDSSVTISNTDDLTKAKLFRNFDDACKTAQYNVMWTTWSSVVGSLVYVAEVTITITAPPEGG